MARSKEVLLRFLSQYVRALNNNEWVEYQLQREEIESIRNLYTQVTRDKFNNWKKYIDTHQYRN